MTEIQGKWHYQSFCQFAGEVDTSKNPPEVKKLPLIAGPWAPPAVMELVKDAAGNITGTAKLGPIESKVSGSVKPTRDNIPEGIELVVTVERFKAIYKLQGFFLANSDHIVGTVVAISNDLGYQPDGTSGPFVLYPDRS